MLQYTGIYIVDKLCNWLTYCRIFYKRSIDTLYKDNGDKTIVGLQTPGSRSL